jgi:preprotein translocase subunit SecG
MLDIILNVGFVLIAIAMIALILLQRGSGAQAGSGFGGGGASGTVFGAQGSANFLSKTTKWLAVLFFALSLFMAWRATHQNTQATPGADGASASESVEDLGVMGNVKDEPEVPASNPSVIPSVAPVIPSTTAPTDPAATPAVVPPAQESATPPATNADEAKEADQKQ